MDACGVGGVTCRTKRLPSVRQSRVVLAPRPWRQAGGQAHSATVANNAAHRGEHGISRKPIARGKPGCPGCTRGSVCTLLPDYRTRLSAGAVGARLSLRPPPSRGPTRCTARAKSCRGNAKVCLLLPNARNSSIWMISGNKLPARLIPFSIPAGPVSLFWEPSSWRQTENCSI